MVEDRRNFGLIPGVQAKLALMMRGAKRKLLAGFTKQWFSAFLSHWDLWLLGAVVALSLGLRLARLDGVPGNVTADELDNLQTAYHILEATGPSFFGFDWKPSPAFSTHLIAGSMKLMGMSIVAMRLPSAVLSTLALVSFYFLARQAISRPAALLAAILLATSLWYLHFSRSGWENVHGALYGTSAALFLDLALQKRRLAYYALCGLFCVLGLLSFFSNAFIIVGIYAYLPFAIVLHKKQRKQILLGYGLVALVAMSLFAPQLRSILENWDHATLRIRVVSIFSVQGEYLGDSSVASILWHQLLRTVRGFLLMDTSVMGYGYWSRYIPPSRGFLDVGTALFFWTGLSASLLYWRRTVLWWLMLLALLVPQVLSTGTPDGARGVAAAPFMYLFVGLGINGFFEGLSMLGRRMKFSRLVLPVVTLALVTLLTLIVWANVRGYFSWMQSHQALRTREPAVDRQLFPYWQALALQAARERRLLGMEEWRKWLDVYGESLTPNGR